MIKVEAVNSGASFWWLTWVIGGIKKRLFGTVVIIRM